ARVPRDRQFPYGCVMPLQLHNNHPWGLIIIIIIIIIIINNKLVIINTLKEVCIYGPSPI
ncbi:MAG: hypothetical protein N7Q72_05075, partial [Spiroplasma sp. Tabriz.8]|nr:hypothetical protein [Spiroplasma sp. Tabriz.8]